MMAKSFIASRRTAFSLIEVLVGLALLPALIASVAALARNVGTQEHEERVLSVLFAESALHNLASQKTVSWSFDQLTFSQGKDVKYVLKSWPDRIGLTTTSDGYLPLISSVDKLKLVSSSEHYARLTLTMKRTGAFEMVVRDATR